MPAKKYVSIAKVEQERKDGNGKVLKIAIAALVIIALLIGGTIAVSALMKGQAERTRQNILLLARSYLDRGEYDRALDKVDQLLERDASDSDALALRDEILGKRDETDDQRIAREKAERDAEQRRLSNSIDKLGNRIQGGDSGPRGTNPVDATNGTSGSKANDALAKQREEERRAAEEAKRRAEEEDRMRKVEADAAAARRRAEEEELAKKSKALRDLMTEINAIVDRGSVKARKTDLSGARKDFEEAVGKFPAGEDKFAGKKHAQMAEAFYDAFKSDPNGDKGQQAVKDAVAQSKESIKRDPTLADPHFTLGKINADLKQWDNAVLELKEATKLDPKNWLYAYELGKAYYMAKRYEDAKQAFNSAASMNPKEERIFYNLALSYKALGDYKNDISNLKKAISLKGDYAMAYVEMGRAYTELKDGINATASYRSAIHADPSNAAAMRELAVIQIDSGNHKEAERLLETAIAVSDDAATNYNLAVTEIELGKPDEALVHAQRAVKLRPSDPVYLYTLGLAYEDNGKMDEAITAYSNSAAYDKKYDKPRVNLGKIFLEEGFEDKALGYLEEAYKINSSGFEVNNNLGNAYLKKGLYERAIQHYEKALSASPREPEPRYNVAKAYASSGQLEKARNAYVDLLKLVPGHFDAAYELGKVYVTLGENDKAKKTLQDLLNRKPDFDKRDEVERILSTL